jgi:hypothetical protein
VADATMEVGTAEDSLGGVLTEGECEVAAEKNAPNRSMEEPTQMESRLDGPMDAEEAEEAVKQILEALRARGLKVPEWIVTKCRERVVEILERGFSGRLKLVLEAIGGQVADLDIIEAEDSTT